MPTTKGAWVKIAAIGKTQQKLDFKNLSRIEKIKVKQCFRYRYFTASYCPMCPYFPICEELDENER